MRSGDRLVTHEYQQDERVGAHPVGLVVGAGGAGMDVGDEVQWGSSECVSVGAAGERRLWCDARAGERPRQ